MFIKNGSLLFLYDYLNVFYFILVSQSQQNKHMLDRLLGQLREVVELACWGRPLGSTILWEQHLTTINRIHEIADQIEIRQVLLIFMVFLKLNVIFNV